MFLTNCFMIPQWDLSSKINLHSSFSMPSYLWRWWLHSSRAVEGQINIHNNKYLPVKMPTKPQKRRKRILWLVIPSLKFLEIWCFQKFTWIACSILAINEDKINFCKIPFASHEMSMQHVLWGWVSSIRKTLIWMKLNYLNVHRGLGKLIELKTY